MSRLHAFAQSFELEPSEYPEPVFEQEKTFGDRLTFLALCIMSSGVMLILTAAALGWVG